MRSIAITIFLLCQFGNAANYYLSPSAVDFAAGTETASWLSFARAVPELAAGDALILKDRIYNERIILEGLHGTEAKPIILRSEDNKRAIIDGSTSPSASSPDAWIAQQKL